MWRLTSLLIQGQTSYRSQLLWIQARIQVYRLLHLYPDNAHTQQWRARLLSLNILPATYTWQFYQHAHAVYIKLPDTTHLLYFYVGSTGASTAGRERTRRAKFLQVCQNKLVSAELALRWWKLHDNYYNYSTIAIIHANSSVQALVKEHQLIQLWQPPLNFPFVTKHLASPSGVVKTRSAISNITHTQRSAGNYGGNYVDATPSYTPLDTAACIDTLYHKPGTSSSTSLNEITNHTNNSNNCASHSTPPTTSTLCTRWQRLRKNRTRALSGPNSPNASETRT